MSYERFCTTYRSLRETHTDDPGAIAKLDKHAAEVAQLRIMDVLSASVIGHMFVEKAQTPPPAKTGSPESSL